MKTTLILLTIIMSTFVYAQKDSLDISFSNANSKHYFSEDKITLKIPLRINVNGLVEENPEIELRVVEKYSNISIAQFSSTTLFLPKENLKEESEVSVYEFPLNFTDLIKDSSYTIVVELFVDNVSTKELHFLQLQKGGKLDFEKILGDRDTIPIGELTLIQHKNIPVYLKITSKNRNTYSMNDKSQNSVKKQKCRDKKFYKKHREFANNYATLPKKELDSLALWVSQKKSVKSPESESSKKLQFKIDSLNIIIAEMAKVDEEQLQSININEAYIVTSEGRLANITVSFDEDEYTGYYVSKGPISLTNFKKKRYYKLYYIGSNPHRENTFIILSSFLNYNHSTSRHFIPSDVEIRFDSDSTSVALYSPANPLTFFDARIYTDAKGLSGEENGLVQTDLNARFIGNTNAIRQSYITFFQYVNVGLSYSKFDSQFDTLELPSLTNRLGSELLRMNQYSNTSLRVETDFIRGSRVHDAYIKFGHLITHTKISADSTFKNVFTPSFYFTLGGTLHAGRRIRADFKLPVLASYLMDQPFNDYRKNWDFVIIPEIEFIVQINKEPSNSTADKPFVFARFRYFDMPYAKGNNFWQIQTGVQVPITNLIKN